MVSRILFNKIVNILKKTKNRPNHPKITAIDRKLEPKSFCSKFSMNLKIIECHYTLKTYVFRKRIKINILIFLNSLLFDHLTQKIYELRFYTELNLILWSYP